MERKACILAAVLVTVGLGGVAPAAAHGSQVPTDAETQQNEYNEIGIATPPDGGPSQVGAWGETVEGEVPAVSAALLPGGDVLYYSGAEADESKEGPTDLQFIWEAHPVDASSRVLDLDTGEVSETNLPDLDPIDLFCSGITVTPDGQAVAPGATDWHTLDEDPPENLETPLRGADQTLIYDANEEPGQAWREAPSMSEARWYPSALQLPDGDTLVASGIKDLFYPTTYNTLLETYDPDEDAWSDLEPSLEVAEGVEAPLHVDESPPETGADVVDDTHTGVPNLPMYPRLHVIPGGPHEGEVLYTGNGDVWAPFGEHPDQALFQHFQTLDPDTGTWTVHEPAPNGMRNLGASVPLMVDAEDPQPKYLSVGGTLHQSGAAVNTAEIVDAGQATVTSTPVELMEMPRWTDNGVLLPDGSVVSVGGSLYDNVFVYSSPTWGPLNLERFVPNEDTTGGTWQTGPTLEDVRAYHSTALLTPDATVLVGGHVPLPAFHDAQRENLNPQRTDTTFEEYEPPYLHHDGETRPQVRTDRLDDRNPDHAASIGDEPGLQAEFGDTLELPVADLEEDLDSVTLMKPGAATHQYNADQMGIEVPAEVVERSDAPGEGPTAIVEIETPSPDEATLNPGAYMAFVLEDVEDGVYPSEAAWLTLE
jgi:hypothetical protein